MKNPPLRVAQVLVAAAGSDLYCKSTLAIHPSPLPLPHGLRPERLRLPQLERALAAEQRALGREQRVHFGDLRQGCGTRDVEEVAVDDDVLHVRDVGEALEATRQEAERAGGEPRERALHQELPM